MSENVQVEAARIPDRDRLLAELRDAGLDARPQNDVGIEVRYEESDADASEELLSEIEHRILSIGAPFVPQKHEGVIYVRPPVS